MRLFLIPTKLSRVPGLSRRSPRPICTSNIRFVISVKLKQTPRQTMSDLSATSSGLVESLDTSINLRGDLDSTNGRPSLKRELSVHSPILTSLSEDEAKHKASAQSAGRTTFSVIGAGGCGTIFRMKDCSKIVKIASSMHSNALRRNFRAHLTAYIKWSSITSITSRYRSPLRAALACATSIPDFTPSSLSWASLPQAQE